MKNHTKPLRVLRGVYTTDAPRVGRRRTRDDLLSAVPVGKVLCLGTVYTGEVQPYVDGTIEAIKPLVGGFASGRVLHAEPGPETLDLGVRLLGDLRDRIASAADKGRRAGFRDGEKKPLDLTELDRAAEQLEAAFSGGEPSEITEGLDRFQRARDSLRRARDSDRLQAEREHASQTLEDLNQKNMAYWSRKDDAPSRETADSARNAPGGPSRRGNTVAEINRRNADFWNRQGGGNGPLDAA